MDIEVRVSGGVTGVRMGGVVDTATLDEQLAQRVERHLTPQRLEQAAAGTGTAGQPDRRQFTVTTHGRRFEVSETDLDHEQITVLDALLTEVAERRRGGEDSGGQGQRGVGGGPEP